MDVRCNVILKFLKLSMLVLNNDRGNLSLTGEPGPEAAPENAGGSSELPVSNDGGSQSAPVTSGVPSGKNDFLNGLDKAIAEDPSLKVFLDEKNGLNVQNLIKSYVHAQKKMGEKGVQVPGKYATDEDWANFYNNLRPAELDKYDVKQTSEKDALFDENSFKEFKTQAHKLGLTTKQAQEIFNFYDGTIRKSIDTETSQSQAAYEAQINDLKKEWGEGDSFKREITLAQRAINEFTDEAMKAEIKKAGLDGNVTMIKLFNKIGKALMKEDVFNQESMGHFGYTKDEAERKLAKIYGDQRHPYWDAAHPEHKFAVDEVSKLHGVGIQE